MTANQSYQRTSSKVDRSCDARWYTVKRGVRSSGRQSNWAAANWATHFGQLSDNIGRVIKDVNVDKIFEILSLW